MKPLLMPQACIDDSGSEPSQPHYILAGFAMSSAGWRSFIDEWQLSLDRQPQLAYFKMKEAARLKDEFDPRKGWIAEKRDDRLTSFTRIINKYAKIRINVSMKNDDFASLIRGIPVPQRKLGIDSPYIYLFMQIILAMASAENSIFTEPCDFIFDEQGGFSAEALAWWPNFMDSLKSAKSDLANFIGLRPLFRDEKQFLPLQAADLYAWQLRHYYELCSKTTLIVPPTPILRQLEKIPAIVRNVAGRELASLRARLMGAGKLHKEAFPNIPLVGYSENKMERKLARNHKVNLGARNVRR